MKHRKVILLAAVFAALASAFFASFTSASQLNFVSDRISDSRLSFPSIHTILFNLSNAIPASGKIIVSFQNTPFAIDPAFSYSDVNLSYSTSSPISGFQNRTLGASPGISNDGVAVTQGTGPITVTLSSGSGIPAGAYLKLLFGTSIATGTYPIVNPSSTASYRVLVNTYKASGVSIDYGAAMVAILPGISVDVNTNKTNPPVISNAMPSGTIPSNIQAVLVSFNTDTFATCHYATTTGVSYDAMTNIIMHDSLGTLQTFVASGIAQGITYNFYVRCQDFAGNKNPSDYLISFTAGNPTGTGSGGGTYGSGNSGGGGGGGAPYPPGGVSMPSLVISGVAFPSLQVSLLRDGITVPQNTTADSLGNFTLNIPSIAQGVYSFSLYINDASGNRISARTFTMTIVGGTANSVTGLVMPPSLALATSTVSPGGKAIITGESVPSSSIEIWVTSQGNLQSPLKVTTSANGAGQFAYTLDTAGFGVDTYQIKARASVPGLEVSNFSDIAFLGVGQKPNPQSAGGDLNGDGKVNLADFSIMLFHWGQKYAPADLNNDGIVDLGDFSILLFHWTG